MAGVGIARCEGALFTFHGQPGGVALCKDGTIWVSDVASGAIWRVDTDGIAEQVVLGRADPGTSRRSPAWPLSPAGLAPAPDGSVLVADRAGHRVCAVDPDGQGRVVAGGANGYRDGPGADALFRSPLDVAVAADGSCYVADSGNDRIRRISPDGVVSTVAGSIYDYGDGQGPDARFRRPGALDMDGDGTCVVADTGNNTVRRVTPDGVVTTVAGTPPGGDADGWGRSVGLRWPTGIAAGGGGTLYVTDHANGALRRIGSDGSSTTWLRLVGWQWPAVVDWLDGHSPVIVGAALDDPHDPASCVVLAGEHGR